MSDFDDLRERDDASIAERDPDAAAAAAAAVAADPEPELDLAASVAGDSVAGTTITAPANPRKRKKSSRA